MPYNIFTVALISLFIMLLNGCVAVPVAGLAMLSDKYVTSNVTSDLSCREIKMEIAQLERNVEIYYSDQINKTMNQYPSAATGMHLESQEVSRIVATIVPSSAPFVQPLLASFLDYKPVGDERIEIVQVNERKNYLLEQYSQKCSTLNSFDETAHEVQTLLNQFGYSCGVADGIPGKKTSQAIREYQRDRGLLVDGRLSAELLAKLKSEK